MSLKIYTVTFFLIFSVPVFSQLNCKTPLPPVLTLVSIQPETGNIDISWNPSPSDSIAAYIVYTYNEATAGWISVDTLRNPSARNYTYITTATKYQSVRFVVAAYRNPLVTGKDGCPSELSNNLSTIFCRTVFDTCRAKITIRWNKYQDSPKKVSRYTILVSENGGPLVEKYDTTSAADSYTLTTFKADAASCYAVKASLDDGSVSFSNQSCLVATLQRPPSWISTDYVRVKNDEDVELGFSIDPASEITSYDLEKAGTSFGLIASLTPSGNILTYTDRNADITRVNYYRLKAINNCNLTALTSEISSNILPVIQNNGNEVIIDWNPVIQGRHSHKYELFVNTGNGFQSEAITDTVTSASLRMEDIVYDITSGRLCFLVKARETDPRGSDGESISSEVCISPEETITVPNLFTPNNDAINDLFRPVLSFTPSSYYLVISNRNGKVLFETTDFSESWNGSGAVQGVYLWHLRLTTPSGKKISRTGTVTIKK